MQMSAAAGITLSNMQAEQTVDERIRDALEELRVRRALNWRIDQDVIQRYMRAVYIDGYFDGLTEDPPLTEEIPMLNHYQLFLP